MNLIKQLIISSIFFALSPAVVASSLKSQLFYYDETEAGAGVQAMRYIINDQFLRIDSGSEETDFILFDRAKKTIFSVNNGDQTILKITNKPWTSPSYDFDIDSEEKLLTDAPKVFGKQVYRYHLKADGDVCTQVLMVKDIYAKELNVLYEFQMIMSGQQASTLINTPVELHTPCFLVDQVFNKAEYLKIGFPIQISHSREYSKLLKDVKEENIEASLFLLPEAYKETSPFTQ